MNNCFRVFHNGRLFAIVKTEADADWLINTFAGPNGNWRGNYWEAAFIPNVRF